MINQPWKHKNWFTFQKVKEVASDKSFSLTGSSPISRVSFYEFIEGKQTIDLTQVLGWETLPLESNKTHIFGIEALRVYLSGPIITFIDLFNQTGNPMKKLWEWDGNQYVSLGSVTITRPEMTQIDDFFDAMRDAKLL